VDPKLLNWTEGLAHYSNLTLSDRFELLSTRYLPLIQTLIDGWIHTASAVGIPYLVVPFSSVTQQLLPLAQEIAPTLARCPFLFLARLIPNACPGIARRFPAFN
tara:strand:- start:623 stop:934 length:312 start_codon:yes stop_codon:yes gene_type:complete